MKSYRYVALAIFIKLFVLSLNSTFSSITHDPIDSLLQIGDYLIQKDAPDKVSAVENYLMALKLAEESKNDGRSFEALKKLIHHFIYTDILNTNLIEYLDKHQIYSKDSLDLSYNHFLRVKYSHELAAKLDQPHFIPTSKWDELILFNKRRANYDLLAKIFATRAIYSEIHLKDYQLAQDNYMNAIDAAYQIGVSEGEKRSYISYQNLARMYQQKGNIEEALIYFKKGLDCSGIQSTSFAKILSFSWISENYAQLNQIDSAYRYLKKENLARQQFEREKQNTAIKEFQEKYQNEKLTNDLSQETIKRKQFYITSLSLGGLLSISLLGLWGVRRINRLKQVNLKQQIKETEQQGQLAAINAQLDGEEQERKRVASVLHDGIASHLTAASFHLQVLSQQSDSTQVADKAAHLIVEAAERTRKLSHELYPPVLIRDGLIPALKALVDSYSNQVIEFELEEQCTALKISSSLEAKLYFIVVELLQNVIKHSQAGRCQVAVFCNEEIVQLSILDNGFGFEKNKSKQGLGIHSISARISNIGGTFEIANNDPQGTIVSIEIPLSQSHLN